MLGYINHPDILKANIASAIRAETRRHARPVVGITRRMKDCLRAIRDLQAEHGHTPSYLEVASRIGIKSKSGIARLMRLLEERGYVERSNGGRRSFTIVGPIP